MGKIKNNDRLKQIFIMIDYMIDHVIKLKFVLKYIILTLFNNYCNENVRR